MTRKDYIAIARAINVSHIYLTDNRAQREIDAANNTAKLAALHIAEYFATDNPLFDRARFLAACGVHS